MLVLLQNRCDCLKCLNPRAHTGVLVTHQPGGIAPSAGSPVPHSLHRPFTALVCRPPSCRQPTPSRPVRPVDPSPIGSILPDTFGRLQGNSPPGRPRCAANSPQLNVVSRPSGSYLISPCPDVSYGGSHESVYRFAGARGRNRRGRVSPTPLLARQALNALGSGRRACPERSRGDARDTIPARSETGLFSPGQIGTRGPAAQWRYRFR
jgi:hypothetical protein